jgi:hypothetical protein
MIDWRAGEKMSVKEAKEINEKAVWLMMKAFSDDVGSGMIARHFDDGAAIAALCCALGQAFRVMPEVKDFYLSPEHFADCVRTMVLEVSREPGDFPFD